MSLSAMIQKREPVAFATATPATLATLDREPGRTVATVATVATVGVASSAEVDTGNAAHFAWLIHFTDRDPISVTFSPMLDHTETLASYTDAVMAERITSPSSKVGATHEGGALPIRSDQDEQRILAWLDLVGETDLSAIGEVINRCRSDVEARQYFLRRANEVASYGGNDILRS